MPKKNIIATGEYTCKHATKYYKTPEELCKRLQLLFSSKSAGNDSTSVDNEIVEIVDKLITDGVISKEEYKQLLSI